MKITLTRFFPFVATALVSASATACFINPSLLVINPVASAYSLVSKSVELVTSPGASPEPTPAPEVNLDAAKVVDNPDPSTWTKEDWKLYRRQLHFVLQEIRDNVDEKAASLRDLTVPQYRSLMSLWEEIESLESQTFVDPAFSPADRLSFEISMPSPESVAIQKSVILHHEAVLKADGVDTKTIGGATTLGY